MAQNKKKRIHSNSAHQNTPFCKASTHQGDPNVFHPQSVGRQCLPNSLMACVMAAIEQPSNWTTEIMDYILHEGDKLYSNIDVGNELLLPSDLPTCVHINNKVYQIVRGKEAFGSFVENVAETRKIALCRLRWFKLNVSKYQKDVKLSKRCQVVKRCQMSKNETPRLWRRFTKKLN